MALQDVVEMTSKILSAVALLVGAIWFVLNFDLEEKAKSQFVVADLSIHEIGSKVSQGVGFDYVSYSLKLTNTSDKVVDLAGAHIALFAHTVEGVQQFVPEFSVEVDPTTSFSQSDFVDQSREDVFLEVGQRVHFPGYRLNPGEYVNERQVFFFNPDNRLDFDALEASATVVGVNPCKRIWFFATQCDWAGVHFEVSRTQQDNSESCDPVFSRPAPGVARSPKNCLRVVRHVSGQVETVTDRLIVLANARVPYISGN